MNAWRTYFEVLTIETVGEDWPRVVVEKWEEDHVGQRRHVETRGYTPDPPAIVLCAVDAARAFVDWMDSPKDRATLERELAAAVDALDRAE